MTLPISRRFPCRTLLIPPRRAFIGRVAAEAMGIRVASLVPDEADAATSRAADAQLEAWFGKLDGKHRAVFDAPEPNHGYPAIWPRVYRMTTEASYPGESSS